MKVFKIGMEKGIKKVETIIIEIEAKDAEEAGLKAHEMIWKFRDGEKMHYCDKHIEEVVDYTCVTSVTEKIDINLKRIEKMLLSIVGKRFKDKEALEKYVSEIIDFPVKLSEEDPSGLVADYCFIGGLSEEAFIEIYYLLSPYGEYKIFITEVNVENY